MPAPNRRNKGEALAHQIANHSAPRSIDDERDRLKAQRVRDAQGWQHAADALDRASAPTLGQRADEVRTDYERARHLSHYAEDVRKGKAVPPQPIEVPRPIEVQPRYSLDCIDCGYTIRLHSSRPRVPLCPTCKHKRIHKVEKKRRGREEAGR